MAEFTAEHRAAGKITRELSKDAAAFVARADLPAIGDALTRITDRVAEMPRICRGTYVKAMKGDSPTSGIKAFCSMCMEWDEYRVAVRDCTDPACPLYPYRPYRPGDADTSD